jgi:hypothetical protein
MRLLSETPRQHRRVLPAWRNWQRTRLVIGRFRVRVSASAQRMTAGRAARRSPYAAPRYNGEARPPGAPRSGTGTRPARVSALRHPRAEVPRLVQPVELRRIRRNASLWDQLGVAHDLDPHPRRVAEDLLADRDAGDVVDVLQLTVCTCRHAARGLSPTGVDEHGDARATVKCRQRSGRQALHQLSMLGARAARVRPNGLVLVSWGDSRFQQEVPTRS